jgi:hypothetical protein
MWSPPHVAPLQFRTAKDPSERLSTPARAADIRAGGRSTTEQDEERALLTWVAGALALAAGVITLRWWRNRFDSLGRRTPVPWISVLLLLALGMGALVPGVLRGRLERQLSAAATADVGVPVTVHCQSLGAAFTDVGAELGYVRYGGDGVPEHSTLIKRDQCRDLARYLHSDKHEPSRDEVVAVHVLSHESMHMAGTTSEAAAECAATQRDERVGELLGATPADARALAETYWATIYPFMPDDYRSGDCRDGGALDEHLGSGPWSETGDPV